MSITIVANNRYISAETFRTRASRCLDLLMADANQLYLDDEVGPLHPTGGTKRGKFSGWRHRDCSNHLRCLRHLACNRVRSRDGSFLAVSCGALSSRNSCRARSKRLSACCTPLPKGTPGRNYAYAKSGRRSC